MRISKFALLAATAVIATGAASADSPIPHRKSGLWEAVTAMPGLNGRNLTTKYCVDTASEAKMSAFSSNMREKKCSSASITHNMDGSWTSASSCEITPGKVMTSRAVITGDFDSKYTVTIYTNGATTPQMTMTVTYQGACAPGMKGGDVIMPGGRTMNLMDNTMSGAPH
jgi:Protein of unknown function (DUF3617)